MPKEDKRKFLVTNLSVLDDHQGFPIVQGYLSQASTPVEVRTFGSFAFLTIRGISDGPAGKDFEYPIPLEDAMAIMDAHCSPRVTHKTRHLIPCGDEVLEVDVYNGKLSGLVIAELASGSLLDALTLPNWLGPEVTGDPSFEDCALAQMETVPMIQAEDSK